jgi:zinc D-Ala-D-Ala dipeptidase
MNVIPADCRQLVVVTTSGWTNVDGTLRCFQRTRDKQWKEAARPIAIVVGRGGMGLANGTQILIKHLVGTKHEGDGCSPAGIFKLPNAFGYASPEDARWIKLPYIQCTGTIECVDDGKSSHYNQVVDARKVAKRDWDSSEQMLRKDVVYRWGVVVDHNSTHTPGDGSCIFLHIWNGPGKGTTGCTAMAELDLKHLLQWLDPKSKPLLVQFPELEYSELQKPLHLPMIGP